MKTQRPALPWALLALAVCGPGAARAQGFSLEGAVIDSRSSQNLGVVSESGDLKALFRAQKAMTFGILRSAGISLEQLPPEVRARIERYQTTNVEAFRAFSQGLDLKDQGRFAEAKVFFRRAAELDPGFGLAGEQQRAMPEVNLGTGVQTRAVVLAAAGAAVDRGKATIAVDASRAAAALASGLTVVVTNTPSESSQASTAGGYTSNPAGSSGQYLPNLAVALTYPTASTSGTVFNLATSNEYRAGDYVVASGNVLDSAGNLARGFIAQRQGATASDTGSLTLADGAPGGGTPTTVYWGRWNSAAGASASVTVGSSTFTAPTLGPVDYVYANATRQMPGTGTGTFTPAGGLLAGAAGRIQVDFLNRNVAVQDLGFTLNGFTFTGLNGTASYAASSASGAFNGSYTAGNCGGCTGFTPSNGAFGGNFVGNDAAGLLFSTFLFTGPTTSVSGVHAFKR